MILKELREWESSREVSVIYGLITRNKKMLKEKAQSFFIKQGQYTVIHSDNLINILKEILKGIKMSNTQWKILVGIADREKNNFIDFELFLSLVSNSAKLASSHPRI